MKTPKRDYYYYEHGINPENGDIIMEPLSTPLYDSRWKRKNRIAQLKRSLHKYKYGTMLPKLQALRLAYKWMQELKKPQQDAEVIHWYTYLSDLKTIQREIDRAVEDAATCLGVAIERKDRKEQK